MSYSTLLQMPYMAAAQAQKHITHNEALERLDAVVQLVVQSFSETQPPAAPEEGQIWCIGLGGVNDWATHDGELAVYANGGWLFIEPRAGWRAVQGTELRVFDGTTWVFPDQGELQNLAGVGVNTSYDATNKLAVAADATLLSHVGAGHQLKLNKNAATDTASLLFQTGWSGRAEMGTMGDDRFAIKVSPDGATWTEVLGFDALTGTLEGSALVQGPSDTTAGRLLTTDAGPAQAFRRGNILGAVTQSAGLPTGAIMEHGTNSNGEYVRLADGTQICYGEEYASSASDATWVYPANFVAPPTVTGTPRQGPRVISMGSTLPTASSASFQAWYMSSSPLRSTNLCMLVAIGRWF